MELGLVYKGCKICIRNYENFLSKKVTKQLRKNMCFIIKFGAALSRNQVLQEKIRAFKKIYKYFMTKKIGPTHQKIIRTK